MRKGTRHEQEKCEERGTRGTHTWRDNLNHERDLVLAGDVAKKIFVFVGFWSEKNTRERG
jgi:hypothetical protein